MPNEPLSTQNYVQIGDKVLNRTADAAVTTNDVSLSDRIFVFKKNEDGSIKTVVNTTIQYIVDAFSADATAIKNSTKEYCDQIKVDTSQLKADTEELKNTAVTAKTSAESARDSAISAKNSASTSATNASSSETLARKWASNPVDAVVADSKYSAYHYSVKAGASATSASTSANTATTKASEASASASSASTSATNASSSASSASASATTASTKASEASTSANQAKGYRDEAKGFRDEINPASFALKVHTHTKSQITDFPSVFPTNWDNVSGKPSTFLPAGTVIWYSGKSLPSGYLVCNGQSLNKTTYANLFNAIGYTYGGSGNNFNVPNLSDGNGRFIRATTDFSKVGTKEDDAIRNITGYTDIPKANWERYTNDGTPNRNGAFTGGAGDTSGNKASWAGSSFRVYFDASRVVPTANEVRPYFIRLLPLIAY